MAVLAGTFRPAPTIATGSPAALWWLVSDARSRSGIACRVQPRGRGPGYPFPSQPGPTRSSGVSLLSS
ncbi:hypothetical protein E2562_018613 [Oryza meyeriana var. granulata]|uniref:Uncharacterized protein n=1 Tax=Oryza meyeriana var. granulata TaxID=110450 RepID=A0A6G1BXT3_9ORYZ|nr:hypothetical protein E2562_018613 [Oryza meyeriana var. granulata]